MTRYEYRSWSFSEWVEIPDDAIAVRVENGSPRFVCWLQPIPDDTPKENA